MKFSSPANLLTSLKNLNFLIFFSRAIFMQGHKEHLYWVQSNEESTDNSKKKLAVYQHNYHNLGETKF